MLVNFLKRPGYLILVLKILEGRYRVVGHNRSLWHLIIVDLCFFEYLVSTVSFLWSLSSCLSLNLCLINIKSACIMTCHKTTLLANLSSFE